MSLIGNISGRAILWERMKRVARHPGEYMAGLHPFTRTTVEDMISKGGTRQFRLWDANSGIPPQVRKALAKSGKIEAISVAMTEDSSQQENILAGHLRSSLRVITLFPDIVISTTVHHSVKLVVISAASIDAQLKTTAEGILANLSRPNPFTLNYWRGKLAGMVMEDAARVPKFQALTSKLLTLQATNASKIKQAAELSQEVKNQFPKHERKNLNLLLRIGFLVSDLVPIIFYFSFQILMKQSAKLFIAGENMEQAVKSMARLNKAGAGYVLDFVAEEAKTAADAETNIQRYLDAMDHLPRQREKVVSIKLTGLVPNFTPEEGQSFDESKKGEAIAALSRLAVKASSTGTTIVIDMERYSVKDATLSILEEFHSQSNYKYVPNVGIVIQTYLQDSILDITRLAQLANKCYQESGRNEKLFVRLVKGAYQVKDKAHVLGSHEEVNRRIIACLDIALQAAGLRITVASHNLNTISEAQALATEKNVELDFEMLMGMPAAPMLFALGQQGRNVRFYLPVGSFEESIGYFMRRMVENASSSSCQNLFTQYYTGEIGPEEFLARAFSPAEAAA
ncbi:MAG: proline dehydrogenase family protein [Patescibacteria group bacterium]